MTPDRIEVIAPQKIQPLAVSVEDAGRIVSISGRTLQKHIAAGTLPVSRIGHRVVIRLSTLDKWLALHEGAE